MSVTVGRYERVGAIKGPLTIGGAKNMMTNDPSFVYLPSHKRAGPKADIEVWITENHPSELKKLLASCYSAANLKKQGVRKTYESEMSTWKTNKEDAAKRRQEERNSNLLVLVELYKIYQQQKKTHTIETDTTVKKTPAKRDLRSRVVQCGQTGKVLDVSSSKFTSVVMKDNSIKKRLSTDDQDPLFNVVYNPKSKKLEEGVRKFMTGYAGFTEDVVTSTIEDIVAGRDVSLTTFTVSERRSSPLSRPFSSPVRRKQDDSVDDLLDSLE